MLEIRDVVLSFGDLPVLRGISLAAAEGEIVCLLGPSGCGKTTLLRVVAGLETPARGDVIFAGRSVREVPVHRRGFGLMFQDFALFPHMDVAGNVAFGLKMQAVPAAERQRQVQEVLSLVGLAGFERRDVAKLSGGEKQRVALARSLAPSPRLLMLDEPLGSLDAALRERLVIEIREIIKQVGRTALYVTHDQHEAFAIADRIAIMNEGRFEQVGTPEAVYRRPASAFVARFLGLNNILPVAGREGNRIRTAVGQFRLEAHADAEAVLLHPDGFEPSAAGSPEVIAGLVERRVFLGDAYQFQLRAGGVGLMFKLPAQADGLPQVGENMSVRLLPEYVVPLNGRDGVNG